MKKLTYICFLTCLFILHGCFVKSGDIFILPKGFKGYVLIIYGQNQGGTIKKNDGHDYYQIPQNGILRVYEKYDSGLQKQDQIYYDAIHENNRVFIVDIPQNYPKKNVCASGTQNGVKNYSDSIEIRFSVFHIGTASQIEQSKKDFYKLDLDSLFRDSVTFF